MARGPKTTLTWKTYTETADGMSGFTQTRAKIKDITGVLSTLSDKERMMYGKKAEDAQYKFIIDFILSRRELNGVETVIQTKDRLYSGTRVFEIVGKEDPMSQERFTILLLSEAVNG